MKKKITSVLLIFLLITSIISISVISFADDNVDGQYSYTSESGVLEILSDDAMIDYTENASDTTPWYSYKADIKKIVISDGVTKVGSYCFTRMDNLSEVVIPNSVTKIGDAAFAGNDKLLSITIPDSVTAIGSNAFGYNRQMKITDGFVCSCSAGSVAQDYCFKNYIPFDAPVPDSYASQVVVAEGGKQTMWSICPANDMVVTFYSTGGFDTIGFVFDASSYIYSDVYNTMKNSAVAFNDDGGSNLNFKITTKLEAGKRYYLSTRFSLPSKIGKYNVEFCIEHSNSITSFNKETGDVGLSCDNCGAKQTVNFVQAVKNNNLALDLNNDGIVNAKDYAIILHSEI